MEIFRLDYSFMTSFEVCYLAVILYLIGAVYQLIC